MMKEERPFFRVVHVSKHEAAIQQIEAAISAFHAGQFAAAITLAGAAEEMASAKAGGLWEMISRQSNCPSCDQGMDRETEQDSKLAEARYRGIHTQPGRR